jgi:hypothetical protein
MKHIILILLLVSCAPAQSECPFNDVIVGDSRVSGGDWRSVGICNAGVNGDGAMNIQVRIKEINKTGKYYLQMGRNDLHYYGFTVAETFNNYVNAINNAKGEVIVLSTIPDSEQWDNSDIAELNSLLKDYCKLADIKYLNVNKLLAPDGYLVYHYDGIHLTDEGYKLIKEAINGQDIQYYITNRDNSSPDNTNNRAWVCHWPLYSWPDETTASPDGELRVLGTRSD